MNVEGATWHAIVLDPEPFAATKALLAETFGLTPVPDRESLITDASGPDQFRELAALLRSGPADSRPARPSGSERAPFVLPEGLGGRGVETAHLLPGGHTGGGGRRAPRELRD